MRWLPIKDFEDLYEVSDTGLVRSKDRQITSKTGSVKIFKGKIKAQKPNKNVKYMQVKLYKNNKSYHKYVHRLVAEAFISNPKNLTEVNHINGNRQDNRVENLEWVDRIGNAVHAIKTGLKTYTNRLSKADFLVLLNRVIQGESYNDLINDPTVPYQVPFLSTKLRQYAKEFGKEVELNEALKLQKQKRACQSGLKKRKYRKIGMYSLEGELLNTFHSIAEAAKAIRYKHEGAIYNALTGFCNSAGGYKWKFL